MTLASQAADAMPSTAAIATSAALVTATALIISREFLWPRWARVLKSPLRTVLPSMSAEDTKSLVYQPDQFPGARDVETPVSYPRYLLVPFALHSHVSSMAQYESTSLAPKMAKRSSLFTASPPLASPSLTSPTTSSSADAVLCSL